MNHISKTVWTLSLVSLFTDMASEMLYPIMPIYLKSIGFSIVLIGVLEGLAEATAGISKGYFGKLSDLSGKRVPFVQIGYSLSAVSKPMMAFFIYPLWIFFARSIDRIGKGIRTGARDALLSDESTPQTKGTVFGFHRSMDTVGAVLGPLGALIYLYYFPADYTTLFYLAFIPGLIAVISTLLLRDKKTTHTEKQNLKKEPIFSFLNYWHQSPDQYRKIVTGFLIFALLNSSDVFLLLKVKQSGIPDPMVIGLYIFYNLVYALSAYWLGKKSDVIGFKKMYLFGLGLFSIVYIGMSFSTTLLNYAILFFLYGIYAAATEGVSKAWISNITEKKDTATALGSYSGFQTICAFLASSIAGFIWYQWGSSISFIITGIGSILVILYFTITIRQEHSGT